VVETDRGGKSTFHGPGQLVCYPILDLKRHGRDVKQYVRNLEEALIGTLAPLGIAGTRLEGLTGVWLERPPRKIASIGVHVSRGITTHGFAVNVELDLAPFDWVVACGLPDVRMTSIAHELACLPPAMGGAPGGSATRAPGLACFRKEMAYRFCLAHGRRQRLVSAARLGIEGAPSICGAPTGAKPIKSISTASPQVVPA
jgi:lipoyl(octanoyl) transferase